MDNDLEKLLGDYSDQIEARTSNIYKNIKKMLLNELGSEEEATKAFEKLMDRHSKSYLQMTNDQKKAFNEFSKEQAEDRKKQLEAQILYNKLQAESTELTEEQRKQHAENAKEEEAELKQKQKELDDLEKKEHARLMSAKKDQRDKDKEDRAAAKQRVENAKKEVEDKAKAVEEAEKKLFHANAKGNKEDIKAAEEELEKAKEAKGDADEELDAAERQKAGLKTELTSKLDSSSALLQILAGRKKDKIVESEEEKKSKSAGKIMGELVAAAVTAKLDAQFNKAEQILLTNSVRMNATLQGTGKTFQKLSNDITDTLMFSGLADVTKVLENLSNLTDKGIAYNLEQRAFLATVSDNIVHTFEVMNANLLQIVRIQREDSTIARMGMESSLQTFLNSKFLDTSYLSDVFDQVTSSLLEASSTMTAQEAAEFEYIVQKWMGSLYSVGMDSSFITNVASALNMLSTGDVQGLSSNSAMQSLISMSASRAGLDYANLLKTGLNADNTNKLLQSMVEYLGEIADSTSNNKVVAGAYSSIFNMSLTDLKAVQNLTSEIENVYKSTLTYAQMESETIWQTSSGLRERMPVAARINNLINNMTYSAASAVTNWAPSYLLYKAADLLGGALGEQTFQINFLKASLGINQDLMGLVKSGILGIGLIATLGGGLNKLTEGGTVLERFASDQKMVGTGSTKRDRTGTSTRLSAHSNISQDEIESDTLNSQSERAAKNKKKYEMNEENAANAEKNINDLYVAMFGSSEDSGVVTNIGTNISQTKTILEKTYVSASDAIRVVITGMDMGELGMPVRLSGNDSSGYEQLRPILNDIYNGNTIYQNTMLDTFYNLSSEDGSSIDVNLAGSDISLTSMMGSTSAISTSNKSGAQKILSKNYAQSTNGIARQSI